MRDILEFEPLRKFVKKVGPHVEKYFGKDPSCIVYLNPHGIFYAAGLFEWLKNKKLDVLLGTMEDDGTGLEENMVKGRKVLIVDGDIISGKAYKQSTEALRLKKSTLNIKDIKFAAYVDRAGLADFSVWNYSAEATWRPVDLDALDLKIVSLLKKDGRMSFTEIGEKLQISGVAVKNRVELLRERNIIEIQGSLRMDKFYSISVSIRIDADQKAILKLVEKFEKRQEVYHLVKRSGSYNLAVGFLARNIEEVENFIEKEVRSVVGIRNINIHIGELPLVPKTFSLSL